MYAVTGLHRMHAAEGSDVVSASVFRHGHAYTLSERPAVCTVAGCVCDTATVGIPVGASQGCPCRVASLADGLVGDCSRAHRPPAAKSCREADLVPTALKKPSPARQGGADEAVPAGAKLESC